MREEEGDPDERARRVGGGAGKRGASEQRRQVGPGAQGERATRGGERELTWERGAGRAGLCARVSWARRLFWAGSGGDSLGKKGERGGGGPGCWAAGKGEVGCGFGLGFWVFFPIPSSLLFLIQTKFEFKFKFEFKPHSIN